MKARIKRNDMELYVAVEAVGMSFSVAAMSNREGVILAAVRGKPCCLHSSDRGILRTALMTLLNDLQKGYSEEIDWANCTLCIGLTGVTFPYDAAIDLPDELARIDVQVPKGRLICTGDAEIITAAYSQETQAAALIAHMGSTAYIYDNSTTRRFGGWGPQLGDEGSAFSIGRNAVRRTLWEYDCRLPQSTMWRFMSKWLDAPRPHRPCWDMSADRWKLCKTQCVQSKQDDRTALFNLTNVLSARDTEYWRCLASGLSIPVMRAWQQGDAVAKEIIIEAAKALATQLVTLLGKSYPNISKLPLILYGGLFRHHPDFRQLVLSFIKEMASTDEINAVYPDDPIGMRPVCGALLFALAHSTESTLTLPPAEVIHRIRSSASSDKFRETLQNE